MTNQSPRYNNFNFTKPRWPILLATSLLVLGGCSDSDPVSPMRFGVFLDSAVAGLDYVTETQSGTTDSAGTFNYIAGETITFSIGTMELPTVRAASTITPLDIYASNDVRTLPVVNLSRLLQSLDSDGNTDNGIVIGNDSVFTSDTQLNFFGAEFDQQANTLLQNSGSAVSTLIDANTASAHLQQTLIDNGLISNDCTSIHPYVGRQASFSTEFHNVSGTLTVLDDCTLQVQNFNYDGQGPAVYLYAATDRQYDATDAFIMGPQLNGQVYVNDTIRLTLPDGKTLNDLNSISVWCAEVGISFGDAFFGDL